MSASCPEYKLYLLPLGDTVRPDNALPVEPRALELQTSSNYFIQDKKKLLNLKYVLVISQLLCDNIIYQSEAILRPVNIG